jgi:hypothetical protein
MLMRKKNSVKNISKKKKWRKIKKLTMTEFYSYILFTVFNKCFSTSESCYALSKFFSHSATHT